MRPGIYNIDYCFDSVATLTGAICIAFFVVEFLLTGETMKLFLERLAGGRCSFRDLGMGEAAALRLSKGMRRGQDSPVNKLLKKLARLRRASPGALERKKGFHGIRLFQLRIFCGAKAIINIQYIAELLLKNTLCSIFSLHVS